MAKINVDIQGLRDNAATLDGAVSEMEVIYNRLNSLIAQLEATWDGAASEAYINRLRRDANKVMDAASITKEFAKYGRRTAEKFEAIDRANKLLESALGSAGSVLKGGKKR